MKTMFLILLVSSICFADKQWDEVLEYTASFGGVDVANASLSSKRYINSENKNILKIQFIAKSKPSLKFIFPINDKITIDVDLNTWEPIKVQKKLRQGKYIQNSLASFRTDEKMFIYKIARSLYSYQNILFNYFPKIKLLKLLLVSILFSHHYFVGK